MGHLTCKGVCLKDFKLAIAQSVYINKFFLAHAYLVHKPASHSSRRGLA